MPRAAKAPNKNEENKEQEVSEGKNQNAISQQQDSTASAAPPSNFINYLSTTTGSATITKVLSTSGGGQVLNSIAGVSPYFGDPLSAASNVNKNATSSNYLTTLQLMAETNSFETNVTITVLVQLQGSRKQLRAFDLPINSILPEFAAVLLHTPALLNDPAYEDIDDSAVRRYLLEIRNSWRDSYDVANAHKQVLQEIMKAGANEGYVIVLQSSIMAKIFATYCKVAAAYARSCSGQLDLYEGGYSREDNLDYYLHKTGSKFVDSLLGMFVAEGAARDEVVGVQAYVKAAEAVITNKDEDVTGGSRRQRNETTKSPGSLPPPKPTGNANSKSGKVGDTQQKRTASTKPMRPAGTAAQLAEAVKKAGVLESLRGVDKKKGESILKGRVFRGSSLHYGDDIVDKFLAGTCSI